MYISASIYSNPEKSLVEIIKELDAYQVDYFHVDCNNDLRVFDDIAAIKKHSKTPIDLHIITDQPEKYFELIEAHEIPWVCFQSENIKTPFKYPTIKHSKIGIAVGKDTDVQAFDYYFNEENFDFGLLMTTTPGKSGGTFDENTYEKIKDFKRRYPSKAVHVDGGVNDTVASKLRKLEVDCSVSGSFLLKANEIGEALMKLKSDLNSMNFPVTDLMLKKNQLPILSVEQLSVLRVLQHITEYKTGYCLITDAQDHLVGVITDGDIRQCLIKNIKDLNKLSIEQILNTSPLTLSEQSKVKDAFQLIKKVNKSINFLPVLDANHKLIGCLSFNNIIKRSV